MRSDVTHPVSIEKEVRESTSVLSFILNNHDGLRQLSIHLFQQSSLPEPSFLFASGHFEILIIRLHCVINRLYGLSMFVLLPPNCSVALIALRCIISCPWIHETQCHAKVARIVAYSWAVLMRCSLAVNLHLGSGSGVSFRLLKVFVLYDSPIMIKQWGSTAIQNKVLKILKGRLGFHIWEKEKWQMKVSHSSIYQQNELSMSSSQVNQYIKTSINNHANLSLLWHSYATECS